MTRILIAVTLVLGLSATVRAGTISVDGSLSDWGVTVADNNGSNISAYVPGMFASTDATLLGFMSEDTSDTAGTGFYLGPQYGGQKYDAEWMGVARDGNNLYIAIVSGQRPDSGLDLYGPGDIRLRTTSGIDYGIEVGGGVGGAVNGTDTIRAGDPGATYNLTSHGYTNSVTIGGTGDHLAGNLYEAPTWIDYPDYIPNDDLTQMQFTGGVLKGQGSYFFTLNSSTTQHSIIEVCVDLTWFASGVTSIEWRPSCGNDELVVTMSDAQQPTPVPLPEGAALGMFGLGLLGLGRWVTRRRRRSHTLA